jgi:hypothetical protein
MQEIDRHGALRPEILRHRFGAKQRIEAAAELGFLGHRC